MADLKGTVFTPEIYTGIKKRLEKDPIVKFGELLLFVREKYVPGISYYSLHSYLQRHFPERSSLRKRVWMKEFTIKESLTQLESLHKQVHPLLKSRIKMLIALKKKEATDIYTLAKIVGVHYSSVKQWGDFYKQNGIKGLLAYNRTLKGESMFTPVIPHIKQWIKDNPYGRYPELYDWVKKYHLHKANKATLYVYIHEKLHIRLNRRRIINLSIKESISELKVRHKTAEEILKPRLKLLLLLKQGRKLSIGGFADALGASDTSISKWIRLYASGGMEELVKDNKKRSIITPIHGSLEKWLEKNPESDCRQIHRWLKETHLPEVEYKHVRFYIRIYLKDKYRSGWVLPKLKIKESFAEIKRKQDEVSPKLKRRLDMLRVLKRHQPMKAGDLAKKIGIRNSHTVKMWYNDYEDGGMEELLKHTVRSPLIFHMEPAIQEAITQWLSENQYCGFEQLYQWVKTTYFTGKYSVGLRNYMKQQYLGLPKKITLFSFQVKESLEELKELYEDVLPRLKPRIKMLMIMKNGWNNNKTAFTREVGVVELSIRVWQGLYEKGGLDSLLEFSPGKQFTWKIHKAIKQKIMQEPYNSHALYQWVKRNHISELKEGTFNSYLTRRLKHTIKTKKATL